MAPQTKHIMEEIVWKTEILTSKTTEGYVTNCSNLMDIVIEEEEQEEGNELFDDKVLGLKRKRKRQLSLEKTKKRKFTVGYHNRKLIFLHSNYKFPLMNFYQMIVNWLLDSVSENVPPIWTLIYKEVKHINNGMEHDEILHV